MIKRFNRYELKYVLRADEVNRLIDDLREMVEPDPYGGDLGYRLVSLYYDSPGYDFFWAKIEGIKFRRKLRLRIYVKDVPSLVTEGMVEIKQRINRTVQKRRVKLPLEEAILLCENQAIQSALDPLDQQVVSEVRYLIAAMNLRPTCITAYHRRAFVGGLYDAGLRITFDTDLRYRVHALEVNLDAKNHLFISPEWCIMEVKVNEAVPDWVTSLLARHGCQLRRVSKYCAGLAHSQNMKIMPFAMLPVGEHKNNAESDTAEGSYVDEKSKRFDG